MSSLPTASVILAMLFVTVLATGGGDEACAVGAGECNNGAGPLNDEKDTLTSFIQVGVKKVKAHEQERGPLADLEELTLLAGAADDNVQLTAEALANLGWEPLVKITDSRVAGHFDEAWSMRKGSDCVAVFAGTNDDLDTQQSIAGLMMPPVSMCGFQVHAGYADELGGFMQADNYAEFLQSLADPTTCETVTAVGHSMGGAVASLFAACANVGGPHFGPRKDFRLVTFASPGVATEALYSGTPGTKFQGTRYSITESNGGAEKNLPADTKALRLDLLNLYITLAGAMGAPTDGLEQAKGGIEAGHPPEAVWSNVEPSLVEYAVPTFAIAQGMGPPGSEALQPAIMGAIMAIAGRGELFGAMDLVSSLTTAGHGFLHALVDFQPLANPLKTSSDPSMEKVPASAETSALPKADFFQLIFTVLAGGGDFPNHAICCYTAGSPQCADNFKEGAGREWKACKYSVFR